MSIAEVTSRISEIQAHIQTLAHFAPPGVRGAAGASGQVGSTSSAVAFNDAMTTANAALGLDASGLDGAGLDVSALKAAGLDVSALTGVLSGNGTAAGEAVVAEAKEYLGLPYVWGGSSKTNGVDCSGLIQSVYKTLGYDLPRVSADQARAGRPVASLAQAQPGDILAWDNSSRNNGADHVAIYLGDGKMLHAPRRGENVKIENVTDVPDMIRRIVPDATTTSAFSPTAVTGTVAAAAPTSGPSAPYESLFAAAGAKHGVSPALLREVARAESSFRPDAVSPAGAQGLMQLMPATARGLGVTNSFDPAQAVDGAAKLLATLQQQFGSTELALAAYNAGPGAVIRHDGVPPYAETQNYVRKITAKLGATQ